MPASYPTQAPLICPACGTPVAPGVKFCPRCGNAVYAQPVETTVFTSDSPVIAADVPILIEQCTLYQCGSDLFARCTLRNIGRQRLQAVQADLTVSSVWGDELGTLENIQYLDINAAPNTVFGNAVSIPVPNTEARSASLRITSALFEGERRQPCGENEPIAAAIPLKDAFGSPELAAQYQRQTSFEAVVLPAQTEHFWRCACGVYNPADTDTCPVCKLQKKPVFDSADPEMLRSGLNAYTAQVQEEALKREREAALRQQQETAARAEEAERLAAEQAKKKAHRKKIFKRIILITAAVLLLAVLTYGTVFHLIPLLRYNGANSALENGDYDKAYSEFIALGDYRDCSALATEALYRKGCAQQEAGEYLDASETFRQIPHYRDSDTKQLECIRENDYLDAKALMDDGKYEEAAAIYNKLNNYKDSEKLLNAANYRWAAACMESGNYKKAYSLYSTLSAKDYLDSADLLLQAGYAYGGQCEESGDYITAAATYAEIPTYLDVPDKLPEVLYQAGLQCLSGKQYEDAVKYFEQDKGYKDSNTQCLEAKYLFVMDHRDRTNTTTYSYLTDLKAAGYKDSKEIYASLYRWTVTMVAVSDNEDDDTSKMSSITRYCGYLHMQFKLSGGPPEQSVTLKHVTVFPDGHTENGTWYWEDKWSGSTFGIEWPEGLYNSPSRGATGTLTVKVYDKATGEYLGEGSVYISG